MLQGAMLRCVALLPLASSEMSIIFGWPLQRPGPKQGPRNSNTDARASESPCQYLLQAKCDWLPVENACVLVPCQRLWKLSTNMGSVSASLTEGGGVTNLEGMRCTKRMYKVQHPHRNVPRMRQSAQNIKQIEVARSARSCQTKWCCEVPQRMPHAMK